MGSWIEKMTPIESPEPGFVLHEHLLEVIGHAQRVVFAECPASPGAYRIRWRTCWQTDSARTQRTR